MHISHSDSARNDFYFKVKNEETHANSGTTPLNMLNLGLMSIEKQQKGQLGEDLACGYLVKRGYKILRRNWKVKGGEIDIVARAKNRTLVFVEVKALTGMGRSPEGLIPEDHLTIAKLRKLCRTCQMFIAKNEDLLDEERGWRIDLVAIELMARKESEIRHYENI